MDIQVIDLEAGLGGSKAASPSIEGNKAPQSPKAASPTPQSPKASSPGIPSTGAPTSPGSPPSRPSSISLSGAGTKAGSPSYFSNPTSGATGVPPARRSSLIAPDPGPSPPTSPTAASSAGSGAKRKVTKKLSRAETPGIDGSESPVHAEEVPLPASPTSPKAGGKAEGKAEGKMVVNKVVVKVGGRSEEKAEEGPIVPSAMVFRPFPNPRQPMIPTDEPPPAPLPPTTRRLYHPMDIFTVNASRRDDRALRALDPLPSAASPRPIQPTAEDASSVFTAAFKPRVKAIDGGYRSDYRATGVQPVWVQLRFKHPQHLVIIRVEVIQPEDSGVWRHQLQARTLDRATEEAPGDKGKKRERDRGGNLLSAWVTIAQFVTYGPERLEFSIPRGNLDVGLIGERPIEGLRLETTDSALPCGWQHMQVWADEVGYASFPCYPECKAHLTAHPQKFGNFLTPLLGSKESKDDKGAVDFGDKDVTEDAKVLQAKLSLGLAVDDDGDAAPGAGVSRAPSNWPLILVCLGAWLLCAIYIVMLVYVALVMYTSPKVVREGCPNDLTILGCKAPESGNEGCGPVNGLFNYLGAILLTEGLLTLFRTTRTMKLSARLGVVWRTKDPREAAAARGETVGLLEELGFIYLGIAPEGGYLRGLSPSAYLIILFQACFGFIGGFSTPVCRRFYLQTHRTLGLLSFGLLVYYLSVGLLVLVTFVVVMRRYVAQHLDLVTTLRDLKW